MPNATNMMEPLRAWWAGATPPTRAAAVGLCLLVIIGLALAAMMAASPDYVPIYHGVSGKDASAIETVLRAHTIDMHFDDKDGTVSVPSKDESNATMYVEAAGILSKDSDIVGIESLDKIGMGTSTEVERKRILTADEGELARKLMKLDPVDTAAVTISPGDSSSLFGTDVAPTASIILGLKQGDALNSDQVKGIVYLVAHAVTGLTPQNVTLVDQTGKSMWQPDSAGDNMSGDSDPLNQNAKFSETERIRLQDLLDSTIGPRKAIVTVNAELDFDQTQTDSVQHQAGPAVSTHEKTETLANAGSSAIGGAAGAASNGLGGPTTYPAGAGGAAPGSGGNYKSDDTTTNNDNDTTHTVIQKAPGSIEKLSVAALVDTSVAADNLPKIQASLEAAISKMPGDNTRMVTVQQMTFDTSALKAEQTQMKQLASQQLWSNITKIAAVCIVAILLLILVTRSGARRPLEPHLALTTEGANIGLLEGATDAELENMLEERPLRIEDVLAEMPEVEPVRSKRRRMHAPSIEEQQDLKIEAITEMVNNHPDSVALLMKGWMAE